MIERSSDLSLFQNSPQSDPMGQDFNYTEEFKTVDLDELKKDIDQVMTTSQDRRPADHGHYGPLVFGLNSQLRAIAEVYTCPNCSGHLFFNDREKR